MRRGTRIALGRYPTPVERLGGATLWVKRDDLASEVYGGNKVRKLEWLLGGARDEGKTRILTMGAAGSHQVVATALYGAREGFAVDAVLVGQPWSAHAEQNLRVSLAHGLRATASPGWAIAPSLVMARWGRDASFVPLGGSSVLGTLGFVDAAHELAAQITAGALAEPDVVVVAMGSGGTAAGLAAGFEQLGLRTRVIGVAVSPPARLLEHMAKRLAKKTAEAAGLGTAAALRAAKRIELESGFLGRGYGYATAAGDAATARAKAMGLVLDATYTAKAFACALARSEAGGGRRQERVLYWHTLSTCPLPDLASAPALPPRLAKLLSR